MISILMPIYNGIEFIDNSVFSILQQTFEKWELIIGINGHSPNSDVYKIACIFQNIYPDKIKVLDFYHLQGKSTTLNAMIPYCSYDYVALLDVDDIWIPNKLEIQASYLNIYDVIGTMCIYFGDTFGSPNIPVGDLSEISFLSGNPMINSSVIIRKEYCYWEENGIEDYELWLRLKHKGRTFFNCPEILVKHRIHSDSAFNSKGEHGNKVKELIDYYSDISNNSFYNSF
jgi:glycosyltransferase involved in cell wall biosynthesis